MVERLGDTHGSKRNAGVEKSSGMQGDLFNGALPVIDAIGTGQAAKKILADRKNALAIANDKQNAADAAEVKRELHTISSKYQKSTDNPNPPRFSESTADQRAIIHIFERVFQTDGGIHLARPALLACMGIITEVRALDEIFAAATNAIIRRLRDMSSAMATNADYRQPTKGPLKCRDALNKLGEVRGIVHDFELETLAKKSPQATTLFENITELRHELLRDLVKGAFDPKFVADCRTELGLDTDHEDTWLFEGLRSLMNGKHWEAAKILIEAITSTTFPGISNTVLSSRDRQKQIVQILTLDLEQKDVEAVVRFLDLPLHKISFDIQIGNYLKHESTRPLILHCLAKAADKAAFARAINTHGGTISESDVATARGQESDRIMQALA